MSNIWKRINQPWRAAPAAPGNSNARAASPDVLARLGLSPSERHRPAGLGTERALEFAKSAIADPAAWQESARRKLVDLIGYGRFGGPPGVNHVTNLDDRDGFRHRSLFIKVRDGLDLPVRLIWKAEIAEAAPLSPIICLQGDDAAMHVSWGQAHGEADKAAIAAGGDIARQAAERGFLAVCLEQAGCGLRVETKRPPDSATPIADAAHHALLFGRTLLGERASDVSSVVNWLADGAVGLEVRRDAIHVVGIGEGGASALYAAAADDRIAGVMAAGCVGFLRATLLQRADPDGQLVVPGFLRWFESDAVVALCAPRVCVAVAGSDDPDWPYGGALKVTEAARPLYDAFEAGGRLAAVAVPGAKRFSPDFAWPAFLAALETTAPDKAPG